MLVINQTSSDYYKYVPIFSEHLVIFYTIENISPAIQTAIAFTCTLLQIYMDCFDIDKIKHKT